MDDEILNEPLKKQKNDSGIDEDSLQIRRLRRDFDELEDRVSKLMTEIRSEILSMKNSQNRTGKTINGYTVKELMMLKQIGINPKDLLMGVTTERDGKTQEESIHNPVREMRSRSSGRAAPRESTDSSTGGL